VFDKGLLEIRADNCDWADLLRAVEKATGAVIDSPVISSEPVSIDLGPGQPLEVLTSLLNRSSYDYYIVVGAEPQSVSRITLTMRSAGPRPASSSNAIQRALLEPTPEQGKASLDAQKLQDVQREQQLQFERQFQACIVQGCDQS